MVDLKQNLNRLGPVFGLLLVIGVQGVLIIDIVTFVVAVSSIAFIHIPRPKVSEAGKASQGSLLKESGFGLRFAISYSW